MIFNFMLQNLAPHLDGKKAKLAITADPKTWNN